MGIFLHLTFMVWNRKDCFAVVSPLTFNPEKPLGCSYPADFSRKETATDRGHLLRFD
jgi:hypothetical protein